MRDTNVLKLYEHLRRHSDQDQVLYYDPGVGSPDTLPWTDPSDWLSRKWERMSGLASGRGAFENIGEGYAFLMRQWEPGAQVWIFGFSRGAFTARSISGMVHLFGILAPEHEALLPTLLRVYFAQTEEKMPMSRQVERQRTAEIFLGLQMEPDAARSRDQVAAQLRETFGRPAQVHFVGVWDTVEAIGMPGMQLRMSNPATISNKRILHARQALALDEHRLSFAPRLYVEEDFGEPTSERSLRQRWFRGAHADTGGGYAVSESGLSHQALHWMVEEAVDCGLRTERIPAIPVAETRAVVHDQVYTVPWWAAAGLSVRKTSGPPTPREHVSVPAMGTELESVWDRGRAWPPLLLALLGCLLFNLTQGWLLLGTFSPVRDTLLAAAHFGTAPLNMLCAALQWLADLLIQMRWHAFEWRQHWVTAPSEALRWALIADFGYVLSYTYVLGCWTTWAFFRRAGYRQPGDSTPAWNFLGQALPVLVVADVMENLVLLGATSTDGWRVPLLVSLCGIFSLAKFVGLAGCVVLALLGLLPAPAQNRDALNGSISGQ